MSVHDKHEQFPTTPTLIKRLNIKTNVLQKIRDFKTRKQKEATTDPRLRPYQKEDVNFLKGLKAKGVFNQQRTGKTPTTLVTMKDLGENKNLIIVPKSLMVSWEQEYRRWHGGKVVRIKGHWLKKRRRKEYENIDNHTTIITSYGKATNDLDDLIKTCGFFDACVVDEAHRLRNFRGNRSKKTPTFTKAIMKLGQISKGRYALTGTPSPNYGYNIFGILHFLFPTLFKSFWKFVEYYFTIESQTLYRGGREVSITNPGQYKSEEAKRELAEFLEMISTQRKRIDVMPWLPDVDVEVINLDMNTKQQKYYDEMQLYMETEDLIAEGYLDTMMYLRQIAIDPQLVGLNATGNKTEWLKDYLEDNPETPIIVVSNFTSYLKMLAEHLNAPVMCGDTSEVKRKQLEQRFQQGDLNLLFANIEVIMEGFTFSRAEVMLFVDRSMTYTYNEQTGDRFLPTSEEQAKAKDNQKIIVLNSLESVDIHISQMLATKADSVTITNNYIEYLKVLTRKKS